MRAALETHGAERATPALRPDARPGPPPGSPATGFRPSWLHAVVLVCGAISLRALPANYDVGYYLMLGGRVLDGARPYVDFFEINPPLVIWLSAAVAWVARGLHVPATLVFDVALLAGVAGSWWLACRMLARDARLDPRGLRLLSLVLLVTALPPVWRQLAGEREHLAYLALLPYLALCAARMRGADVPLRRAVAIGALAGAGVALKPYFLALPVLLELATAARRRVPPFLRHPEAAVALSISVLHALAVVLLTPAYFRVARLAMGTYGAYDLTPLQLLTQRAMVVGAAAALLAALARPRGAYRDLAWLGAALLAGFAASALAQRKGFGYHLAPIQASGLLLLGVALAAALSRDGTGHAFPARAGRVGPPLACALLVLAELLSAGAALRLAAGPEMRQVRRLEDVVREGARGGSVLALTSEIAVGFPLVNDAGVAWASRFPAFQMVPAFYPPRADGPPRPRYRAPAEMGPVERELFEDAVEDLLRYRPRVVLVDLGPRHEFGDRPFDWVRYFSADPRFRAEWARYRYRTEIESIRVYERASAAGGR